MTKVKLKELKDQVMVITGATSGIGLTTARMAAEKGAKLVLVARNEEALRELTHEINARGGADGAKVRAAYVAGDVADEETMRRAAQAALENFNGFDTWYQQRGRLALRQSVGRADRGFAAAF